MRCEESANDWGKEGFPNRQARQSWVDGPSLVGLPHLPEGSVATASKAHLDLWGAE